MHDWRHACRPGGAVMNLVERTWAVEQIKGIGCSPPEFFCRPPESHYCKECYVRRQDACRTPIVKSVQSAITSQESARDEKAGQSEEDNNRGSTQQSGQFTQG